MKFSYDENIKYLFSLLSAGIKLGLERTERLLSLISKPQDAFPSVIVGGTNGKGSTAAMIEAILMAGGFKTGLYTSPHLLKFNERIRVSGNDIGDAELAALISGLRDLLNKDAPQLLPSFFEFSTALAFKFFRDTSVDLAVLEVGMGGRLDSTNVVTPLVSVITNVSLDHEGPLGSTLPQIASEKAGIIKKGGVVVTGVSDRSALNVIEGVSLERGAELFILGRDFNVSKTSTGGIDYLGITNNLKSLNLTLKGAHQQRNAACALATLELLEEKGFPVGEADLRSGLESVRWRARFERVSTDPDVIVDCAHNPDAADALISNLKSLSYKRLILVLGFMGDKDIDGILERIAPLAAVAIATKPEAERGASESFVGDKLGKFPLEVITVPVVSLAIESALSRAMHGDLILITGSLYTVGEALSFFQR